MLNLQSLLNLQKELDYCFESVSDITGDQKLTADLLGLITECGEVANELQSHKYWKKQKHLNKSKINEEFADILFFYLSIANTLGFSGKDLEEAYLNKYEKNRLRISEGY